MMQLVSINKTTFQFFDERSDKVDYRTPSEGGVEL